MCSLVLFVFLCFFVVVGYVCSLFFLCFLFVFLSVLFFVYFISFYLFSIVLFGFLCFCLFLFLFFVFIFVQNPESQWIQDFEILEIIGKSIISIISISSNRFEIRNYNFSIVFLLCLCCLMLCVCRFCCS